MSEFITNAEQAERWARERLGALSRERWRVTGNADPVMRAVGAYIAERRYARGVVRAAFLWGFVMGCLAGACWGALWAFLIYAPHPWR